MSKTVPRLIGNGNRRPGSFHHYFRMDRELFDLLESLVTPYIQKQVTRLRRPIPVSTRLGVTLRFLATGHSYSELHYEFRIGWLRLSI